jgi:hypothetical protein
VPVNNLCIIGHATEADGEWHNMVSLRDRQITAHEQFMYSQ